MSPRRILYVITDLEVGGVPLHLLRLASQVSATGADVTVVSLKPPGPIGERLECGGVSVGSCFAAGSADWRIIDRLAAVIRTVGPDLVHSLLFHANQAARAASVLSGFATARLVCEIQTAEIERRWHLQVDRMTHRLCAVTVGNSASVVRHLHDRAGIPMDRLALIRGGVDVAAIHEAPPLDRAALGGDGRALLLWVGRMDPIKGLDTLIATVDRLRRQVAVRLLIAGEGPLRAEVEADVRRRGLRDHVTLLGRRDDVPGLIRTADVFVFPSRTEGMPNALLEAMAGSLPVVTTDVPGCRDLVTDGVTGRLVPVNDAHALADAVAAALTCAEETRQMSANARHLVCREYDLGLCLGRYLALYARVLAEAR